MKKIPKIVFAFWKDYGDGTSLVAVEKAVDALEGELGCVRVGKYKLIEQADVQAIPTILPTKAKSNSAP